MMLGRPLAAEVNSFIGNPFDSILFIYSFINFACVIRGFDETEC